MAAATATHAYDAGWVELLNSATTLHCSPLKKPTSAAAATSSPEQEQRARDGMVATSPSPSPHGPRDVRAYLESRSEELGVEFPIFRVSPSGLGRGNHVNVSVQTDNVDNRHSTPGQVPANIEASTASAVPEPETMCLLKNIAIIGTLSLCLSLSLPVSLPHTRSPQRIICGWSATRVAPPVRKTTPCSLLLCVRHTAVSLRRFGRYGHWQVRRGNLSSRLSAAPTASTFACYHMWFASPAKSFAWPPLRSASRCTYAVYDC